jgi:hypothetical protein
MNSEELDPDNVAVEHAEMALPVLATEKLIDDPEDPTTTLPKFTVPLGEKLSLAAVAFEDTTKELNKNTVSSPTFIVNIGSSF